MERNVIVVGIDGASPDLLGWLFEDGLLPNLQRIRQQGVSGTLLSTRHPITPAAWTSMITGLNPGSHGLFDFKRRVPGGLDVEFTKGRDRDGTTIWHILSESGHTVGTFNMPMSFPPERVNGFWVSGMDTPSKHQHFAEPRTLAPWLERQTGGYQIDVAQTPADTEETYADKVLLLQEKQRVAFESLLTRYQPDACMGVFVAPDRLQHAFWKYIDPREAAFHTAEAGPIRQKFIRCYTDIDDFLGRLLTEHVHERGATLMIVSDHGFGPLHKDVYLNQWLMDHGYLTLKEGNGAPETQTPLFAQIDWHRTSAYSFGYFGNLYLNLRGREPWGTVNPGRQQRQMLDRLRQDLEAWKLPDGSGPLVDAIYETRTLYSGPYVDWGPDLLIVMQNYAYMTRDTYDVPRDIWFSQPMAYQKLPIKHSGNHRMEGIIYVVGDGVKEDHLLSGASVTDIAPTVLHLMGQAVPTYMEGRVLTGALTSEATQVRSHDGYRQESKAPTLHQMARKVALLQDIVHQQDQMIIEQRQQLERSNDPWTKKLIRQLKRIFPVR